VDDYISRRFKGVIVSLLYFQGYRALIW